MKRRDFLKKGSALGMTPLFLSGLPVRSLAVTNPLFSGPCNPTDRVLVIIYLNGANDIINTTVPLDQLSDYATFRPDIRLPENDLITLDGNLPAEQQIGLHPNLTDLKELYDEGLVSIIQRVGYNNPNRSHFKALDNWLTGSGGSLETNTGWLGRFLSDRYPSYTGNPFLGEPDPLGILFGNMNKTGFHTFEEHSYEINLSGQDPAGFYSLISQLSGDPIANIPMTEFGDILTHVSEIENSVNVYAQRISETFNNGSNSGSVTYPDNNLADQLKTIARMLDGGCRTKVFMATTGGFDTHASQVESGATTTGGHANLMTNLATAVKAFQDDLTALGKNNDVLTVVFSEFGRKIIQNGSLGTDHGTLNSIFVIGSAVEGGVIGNNIDLSDQDSPGAPNPTQLEYDYRQVFGTVLQDWLGANDTSLESTFIQPGLYSQKLPFLQTSEIVLSNCYVNPVAPAVCACIQVTVLLEGLYSPDTMEMTTNLADSGLLPLAQPFNTAPFNYAGTETAVSLPDDVSDWLLLELREADDLNSVVSQRAVFVKKDGSVVETDGTPGVTFPGVSTGQYHLVVFSRNHLAVVSNETIILDAPSFVYDFTIAEDQAMGTAQMKNIGGKYVLLAGDVNGDHNLNNTDYAAWNQANGTTGSLNASDLNGDGSVDSADYDLWFDNRSKLGQL